MSYLADIVHDEGVELLKTVADAGNLDLYICSADSSTFTEATSTYALGNQTDCTVTGPTAGDTSGRKVTVGAVSAGDVTATGTASHVALVDSSMSILLLSFALDATVSVTSGETFSLTSFDVESQDPV
jgi:hypothetical protein